MRYYQPWMTEKNVNAIFLALENNARFVGGAVRDTILGNKEITDIDIATTYQPETVISKLQQHKIKVKPTGIKHGTVTAIIDSKPYEITSLRKDVETFGRHAIVAYTDSWQEDAARRDFTINAMFAAQDGTIFDYFNGLEDLQARRLRFVGDAEQRCVEDYLRILRYFRFFTKFGNEPEISALNAFKKLAPGINQLSGERIKTEMFKLLAASNPIYTLQLMISTGVMEYILPSVGNGNVVYLENLLSLTEDTRFKEVNIPAVTRLAVLIGKNSNLADIVSQRWKLSNIEQEMLNFLCDKEMRLPLAKSEFEIKKFIRNTNREKYVNLCFMALASGISQSDFADLYAMQNVEISDFPLKGRDLLQIGIDKGKKLGELLKLAEKYWEEHEYVPDKVNLLEWIKAQ